MKYTFTLFFVSLATLISCHNEETIFDEKPKLDYYLEYSYGLDLGFDPKSKVVYEYNETGSLSKYTILTYNPDTKLMVEQRFFIFVYSDQKIEYIRGYWSGEKDEYIHYHYQYGNDGEILRITERNILANVIGEANFSNSGDNISQVTYTYSNGGGFVYKMNRLNGNILTDSTMRGTDLCSVGRYAYDQQVNPFKELGYVDFQLINLSSNNKVKETMTFEDCYFPSFIPESHIYDYNRNGYPKSVVTTYKGHQKYKTKKEFFYK